MSYIGKVTNFLDLGAVKINSYPKAVPCTSNSLFCQPSNQADDIAFQFEASESTELITNTDFTGSSTGWTKVGWVRVPVLSDWKMQQTAAVNALSQKGILTINDYYRVRFTLSNYSGGTILAGGGTGSAMYNGAITVQENGTYEAYFQYNEAGGAGDFIIQGSAGSSIDTRVDDISVIKISDTSDYTIQIIDKEDATVLATVPTANTRIAGNVITVDYNWTDDITVTNGCRQVQILDNTNLFEDTFASNQGWSLGSQTLITGGVMIYTSTGSDNVSTINNIFVIGESYTITYTTSALTGTGTVTMQCGRTAGTTRSTNATFVETLTCTDLTRLQFTFAGAAASTVSIDNITISKADNIAGRSECYDLQTSHDCTLVLKWSNNESWGGFDYAVPSVGDAFEQALRVEAKFRGTKYPSTRLIGEDSAGVKTVDYTSLRKVKILDIHRSPDYIHDAIAAMWMQDTRTIEDVSYIMEDDYEPSAPNDSRVLFKDFMTSRSELEETDQPSLINRNI